MFERVLKAPLQFYLFHALQSKKKVKIKYINTNLFKDLYQGILLRETYP